VRKVCDAPGFSLHGFGLSRGRRAGGYVCSFASAPGIIFGSSTDETGTLPGLTCSRLDSPLPGSSWTQFATFWKLVRLIEGIP
jgi:hypothetical protein